MSGRLFCVLLLALGTLGCGDKVDLRPKYRLTGPTLWDKAIAHPLPQVSRGAFRNNAKGIVVVDVTIEKDGAPREEQLLEATDPILAGAILDALTDWRFAPTTDQSGRTVSANGRLVFYYVVAGDAVQIFVANDVSQRQQLIDSGFFYAQSR